MAFSKHIQSVLLALICAGGTAVAQDKMPQMPLPVDPLLTPPKADEIVAFANDVKLPRDFKGVAITVDKEKVMEFFTNGEVKAADKDRAHWRTLADFTLPEKILGNPALAAVQTRSAQMLNGRTFFDAFIHTGGVVVTSGGSIYFWRFWNDRVLEVEDESGRGCLLVLGADAKPFAPYAHPYEDYDGAKDPENKLFGKLPWEFDVTAFCNRPDDGGTEGRRSYIFADRMTSFLSHFTVITPRNCVLLSRFDGGLNPFTSEVNAGSLKNGGDPNLMLRMEGPAPNDVICDGVMLTKKNGVIFWRMGNDGIIYLMDEHHRTCCLSCNMGADSAKWQAAAYEQFNMGESPRLSVMTIEEIKKGENWDAYEPAPLDRAKAVRSAWEEFSRDTNETDASAWRVARVTTTRFLADGAWKWFYTVWLENGKQPGAETPVLVSMDGTAGGIYAADDGAKKIQDALTQDYQKLRGRRGMFFGGFGGGGVIVD